MKSFLTRHRLTAEDVRDFVIIVFFIGTLAVLAALGSGA
jgi:hypothetical protein